MQILDIRRLEMMLTDSLGSPTRIDTGAGRVIILDAQAGELVTKADHANDGG